MKKYFFLVLPVIALCFGFVGSASAAMPTASATLETLGTDVVTTGTSLLGTIFTTYWPYFLVFSALVGLIYWFKRAARMGSNR